MLSVRALVLLAASAEAHSHAPQLFLGSRLNGDGPEQQWVALGATPDAMTLSWMTAVANMSSTCQYGTTPAMLLTATGVHGGSQYTTLGYSSGYLHLVRLSGLSLSTVIYYRCGDAARGSWSTPATFTSSPGVGADIPYTFAVIGDLGQTATSNSTMQHVLAAPHVDSVIIAGDVSYADSDQPRWDSFQRLAQPLASSKAWMVASGNQCVAWAARIPPAWGAQLVGALRCARTPLLQLCVASSRNGDPTPPPPPQRARGVALHRLSSALRVDADRWPR